MLADLSTKSHPQARLSSLRRTWSVEKINQDDKPESEVVSSEGDKPKIRVNMMRIKTNQMKKNSKKFDTRLVQEEMIVKQS